MHLGKLPDESKFKKKKKNKKPHIQTVTNTWIV